MTIIIQIAYTFDDVHCGDLTIDPVNNIKDVSLSQIYKIFCDRTTVKRLFPEKYFVVSCCWNPYPANFKHLRKAAMMCDVRASFSADGTTCESVAFVSSIGLGSGSILLDIWIYGSELTVDIIVQYVHFTLLKNKASFVSRMIVYFPKHVDKTRVNGSLSQTLGKRRTDGDFAIDEGRAYLKII